MSEEEATFTSVLLPAARVALFTTDAETREAFKALEGDWRFARVTLEVIEGDVETAARHYGSNQAHDLVIIQTEDIDSGFPEKLEGLAENLNENTAAIVIGPVNDVNLYRKLIGMGVSDYLVKPVKTPQLGEDIAQALIEQIGAADSHLIAVMGAKGGVGTSVIAEALGWHVAGDLGQKTFLMDASGGWSTLSVGIGFDPSTTLHEVLRAAAEGNEDSISRMIHQADEKLFVLSSGGDVMLDDSVEPEQYETFLEYLMALYPVVIVDLSGATAGLKRTVLTRAHQTLLVTTPVLSSVRAARTLLQEMKELRGGSVDDIEVVLNMHGYAPRSEVPKAQISQGLDREIAVTIPFDAELFVSTESEAAKLGQQKTAGDVVKSLLRPVQKLLNVTVKDAGPEEVSKGGIGKLLTKLKTKA